MARSAEAKNRTAAVVKMAADRLKSVKRIIGKKPVVRAVKGR